jgi:hypothetical protein
MNNSWGLVVKETMYSTISMMLNARDYLGIDMTIHDPNHNVIYIGRNILARIAIKEHFDYVLFLDADMTFPPFAITHLLQWDRGIVSGWYCRQTHPHQPYIMYKLPDSNNYVHIHPDADSFKRRTLITCDAVGAGCLLVRTGVFIDIAAEEGWKEGEEKWFGWEDGGRSDDVWFCELAKKHNYYINVDSSVLCGHATHVVYPDNIVGSIKRREVFTWHSGQKPFPAKTPLNFEFLKDHPFKTDKTLNAIAKPITEIREEHEGRKRRLKEVEQKIDGQK